MRRFLFVLASLLLAPRLGFAQGALAVQGFGYPTGQLGTGALGVGGSTAELDPSSALNPAALANRTRYAVYMQLEPEYRRTTVGAATDKSTTIRFPAFVITGGVGRFTAGASFSTLLDRSWQNVYSDSQDVGGVAVPSTLRAGSAGAMNDARFAASYWVGPRVQVGLGIHAIAGQNRVEFGRGFPDSTGLGSVSQSSVIDFSGRAFSGGVLLTPVEGVVIGASVRLGGPLTARQEGVTFAEGNVPTRFGVGVAWYGIPNTTLAARIDRTAWSDLRSLGTAQLSVFDATELGLGVDVVGPQIAGAASLARLGFRDRTLPFGANGNRVSERSLSGGVAIPLSRGRAQIDLALQRSTREAAGAKERAWFLSIGLGIRP